MFVTALEQIQKTKDEGQFTKHHDLLDDVTLAAKNQYPQNLKTKDKAPLALICRMKFVVATESGDVNQAGSNCSSK